MFKLTEFYLQNKCTLASSNPCNKNKVCLKFLSYGVIGISQKKSIQPLEREVSWLQICLSLLTALFARKSRTGRITCVCRVSFQGTKSSSQDRQYLKLMKWREKRQNWLFRHSKGKNHWKSKHCSSGLSLINMWHGMTHMWGNSWEEMEKAVWEKACSTTRQDYRAL